MNDKLWPGVCAVNLMRSASDGWLRRDVNRAAGRGHAADQRLAGAMNWKYAQTSPIARTTASQTTPFLFTGGAALSRAFSWGFGLGRWNFRILSSLKASSGRQASDRRRNVGGSRYPTIGTAGKDAMPCPIPTGWGPAPPWLRTLRSPRAFSQPVRTIRAKMKRAGLVLPAASKVLRLRYINLGESSLCQSLHASISEPPSSS
jgi:hypothetical protein